MPTILTHALVPLAVGICINACLHHKPISPRLIGAGMLAAILPDADVVAFKFGIAYLDQFGHRGASHSLVFALLLGLLLAIAAPFFRSSRVWVVGFIGLAASSHGLLDMCTNGGEGVALFWPFVHERLFFPWQVIEVSPIGLRRIFSARAITVLISEMLWVWLPLLMLTSCILYSQNLRKNQVK